MFHVRYIIHRGFPVTGRVQSSLVSPLSCVDWSFSDFLRLLPDGEDGKSGSLWCIGVGGLRGRPFGLQGAVEEVGRPGRNPTSFPGSLLKNLGTRLGENYPFHR